MSRDRLSALSDFCFSLSRISSSRPNVVHIDCHKLETAISVGYSSGDCSRILKISSSSSVEGISFKFYFTFVKIKPAN